MYDVGNRESFDALDSWLEEIKKDIGNPADFESVAFAVCANKVRRESLHTVFNLLKKCFGTSTLITYMYPRALTVQQSPVRVAQNSFPALSKT